MSFRSRPQDKRPPSGAGIADTLTGAAADFVAACVRVGLNVVVAGKRGVGKTALASTLASFIPSGQRIVLLEGAAGLRIAHEGVQSHLVPMDDRPELLRSVIESEFRGSAGGTWSRMIVDELTGKNAPEILTGMSRHGGWLATGVADSAADLLSRLGGAHGAIDVIVTLVRYASGARVVSAIAEVVHDQAVDLFNRSSGVLEATGVVPVCLSKLKQRGVDLPLELFKI